MRIIAINVAGDQVGEGFGRAHTVVVAQIDGGAIQEWIPYDVGWDVAHDQAASHGAHHATIVRFLNDHDVDAVVSGHIGPPMAHTLEAMGVAAYVGVTGDAREAALHAAADFTPSDPAA